MSVSMTRRIRTWAVAMVAVAGTASMQLSADTFYVNRSCGDDGWSGTSSVCEAPDGPKLTIQAGIDASVDGDTVIVADGTYMGFGNKNLDFGGRPIMLRSLNGPATCILDCENDGRGVWFHSAETADAVLDGFTIRNGEGVNGGGILCESASPTILNCVLANNQSLEGGAFFSRVGDPTISNCTIRANGSFHGGGLFLSGGSPTVTGCTIVGNWVFGTGGGMHNTNSSPTVSNCTFSGNHADHGGGGMSNEGGSPTVSNCAFSRNSAGLNGGGIYNLGSSPIVTNCTFSGNSVNRVGGDGGGMHNEFANPTVSNCTFSDNAARDRGGGMYNTWSRPSVTNCTFSGNSAIVGGGMANAGVSSPIVINCTFSGNSAGRGGGMGSVGRNSIQTAKNCILWNNSPDEIVDFAGSVTTVRLSDVQGGWQGQGNIDADPLFVDPANADYRLAPGSPCIDAADNSAVPAGITNDLDGNPRFVDDPDTPDTGNGTPPIVDMGAYEFQGACNPCDMNCDGDINAFDIEPFLDLLFGEPEPCCEGVGDVNGDGVINAFDIEPFLDCLFP